MKYKDDEIHSQTHTVRDDTTEKKCSGNKVIYSFAVILNGQHTQRIGGNKSATDSFI